jgi:predicted RNA-binding protein with EMAP domain
MRIGKINSISDLEQEKERLRLEIARKEDGIKYSYYNLVDLLSFRNLIGSLLDEVNATSSVLGKVISVGKKLLSKRKKKKKKDDQAAEARPEAGKENADSSANVT